MAVKLGYTNVYRYPDGYPEWHAKSLPVESTSAGLLEAIHKPKPPGPLVGWAIIWTLLGILAHGMALNLTPSVNPLIPITVSHFGGRSGTDKGNLVGNGLCYALGLSLTSSVLAAFAALTGGLMGAVLRYPVVLGLVCAVLIYFATSLFGFWRLRLPRSLTHAASRSHTGYLGSLFLGFALGIVAVPCTGPYVLSLLTWVESMASPWLGFLIFFTLSLGLSLPLFFLAIFSGQIHKLPRFGEWIPWVRKLMGWVLVGMAAYFIRPILPQGAWTFLLAGIVLGAALHLVLIDRTLTGFRAFRWIKACGGVAALATAFLLIGSWIMRGPVVAWQPYSDHLLSEARRSKKSVIVDFCADWCASCRKLDEVTFRDPEIVGQAKQSFTMIKVDLTKKGSPVHEDLLEKYRVKGVPTVVFLDSQGGERHDLRLVDFLPADQFLIRMAEVRKKIGGVRSERS